MNNIKIIVQVFRWLSGLVVAAIVTNSAAATPTYDRTGIFLRAAAGVGGAALSISNHYDANASRSEVERHDVEASQAGVSGSVDVSIGGFVSPNVAMHLELAGLWLPAPSSNYGERWTAPGDAEPVEEDHSVGVEASLLSGSLRVGFTYYLMPAGVYVGSSVGVNWMSFGGAWSKVDPTPGVSATVRVGKEWELTEHLGLGVGLLLDYTDRRLKDDQTLNVALADVSGEIGDADARVPFLWFGLNVSMVWN